MAAEDTSAPPAELLERARRADWYHSMELAPGLVTEGMFDLRPYVERYGLPTRLDGLRVLDVGTFDGFWAFELERRGAQVVALDIDRTQQLDWPPRLRPAEDSERGETFRIAHAIYESSVEHECLSIYDAAPERLGSFDLVFCGSVLIHLRDPMLALERMAALCSGRLVLCEEYSRRLEWLPRVKAVEFRGHTPWMTWWRPTTRTWVEMVRTAGFDDVRRRGRFEIGFRAMRGGVPHVVVHARAPAVNG
jgi:tRNA (mo5U34)-methyltransferase